LSRHLQYSETPVIEFRNSITEAKGIRVLIKREDLNHPLVSGNKWWKLKYNLAKAVDEGFATILTFGGAFSNHIHATAAAARELELQSIGVIRGERTEPLNHTLKFSAAQGMNLHFISRGDYRKKTSPEFINKLREKFGDFFLIPEGGTNELALKGCAEFADDKLSQIQFDHLFIGVGTGGTISGLISALDPRKKITGVSVLKNGEFLKQDVTRLIENFSGKNYGNWNVLTSYDHGGYAKVTDALKRFIVMMRDVHNLPFDHVYTGKMMFALLREIERDAFPRGTTVLAVHTGGLQGSLIL
jgi:1-aminocyclopropane-1-carboxylate deaminase